MFNSMGKAFKNIGLDEKGNESQTLKQKVQEPIVALFGSDSESAQGPKKPNKEKKKKVEKERKKRNSFLS